MSVNSFFQGIDLIPEMPDISNISFENIIDLPDNVYVHDFESNNKFQDTSNSFSICLLYTSPSPRDRQKSRMPSSA